MCFANQHSLKALLILLCYMYTFNAKHAACLSAFSPYADYFNILILSCTYIHTHYVHTYLHTRYVYSCTHTYKQTNTHTHTFVLLPWFPFVCTYFKMWCQLSVNCKPAQIIVWYENPHVMDLCKGDCVDCFKLLQGFYTLAENSTTSVQ